MYWFNPTSADWPPLYHPSFHPSPLRLSITAACFVPLRCQRPELNRRQLRSRAINTTTCLLSSDYRGTRPLSPRGSLKVLWSTLDTAAVASCSPHKAFQVKGSEPQRSERCPGGSHWLLLLCPRWAAARCYSVRGWGQWRLRPFHSPSSQLHLPLPYLQEWSQKTISLNMVQCKINSCEIVCKKKPS